MLIEIRFAAFTGFKLTFKTSLYIEFKEGLIIGARGRGGLYSGRLIITCSFCLQADGSINSMEGGGLFISGGWGRVGL